MRRLVTPLIAASTLVAAFAVGEVTDSRLLGTGVLAAGAGWCALRELNRTAFWRLMLISTIAALAFVLSHRLGDLIGAWPAVLLAAALTGSAAALLLNHASATEPTPPTR